MGDTPPLHVEAYHNVHLLYSAGMQGDPQAGQAYDGYHETLGKPLHICAGFMETFSASGLAPAPALAGWEVTITYVCSTCAKKLTSHKPSDQPPDRANAKQLATAGVVKKKAEAKEPTAAVDLAD